MTIAVLDACVLYPPSLRDLLMRIASVGSYEPRLTEEIHDEWTRNVLANNRNIKPTQLDRTRRLMNQVAPNCLVFGYEAHISTFTLPDLDDRHVLAAAIEAKAKWIVTFNLSDFPNAVLQRYNVQAVHPDYFLSALFDKNAKLFLQGVQAHRASLKKPPKTVEDYLQTLRTNRLKRLTLRLEAHTAEI
jgi:predicted nucleic acid-binding protein